MFGKKTKRIQELEHDLVKSQEQNRDKDIQIQELLDRVFTLENIICPGEQHRWKVAHEEVVIGHPLSNVSICGRNFRSGPQVNRRLTCSKCFATKQITTYIDKVMEEQVEDEAGCGEADCNRA